MLNEKTIEQIIPSAFRQETDLVFMKVKISPELALNWLKRNVKNNRRVSKSNTDQLLQDVRGGKWNSNSGEVIKFDTDGNLLDGQHRLKTIILSETTLETHVVLNASSTGFVTLDTGKKRSFSDVLVIEGFTTYVKDFAVIIKRSEAMFSGRYSSKVPPTNSQMLIVAKDQRVDIEYVCQKAASLVKECEVMKRSEYGIFLRVFKRVNLDDALEFFRLFVEGYGADTNHPTYRLRNVLIKDAKALSKNLSPMERYALIILAWNAYFDNQNMTKLRWGVDQKFPQVRGLEGIIGERNKEREVKSYEIDLFGQE